MSTEDDEALTLQIGEAIAASIQDVDASGVSAGDRAAVLRAVLSARLGGSAPAVAPTVVAPVVKAPVAPVDDDDVLGKIAARMHVERDALELIYDVQDGEPNVVISAKKLPGNKAQATKLLAQLVVGARQAAGLEEWTPVGEVRSVVTEFGSLDSGNFAATVRQLDSVCLLRGKGVNRELKVTKPGMEEIASVINGLAGVSA